MNKELSIVPPEGYEIDKDNSTFERIVFKKLIPILEWNEVFDMVEIKDEGEHFLVDASPSYLCSWDDAQRLAEHRSFHCPTVKQLRLMCKHKESINRLLKQNGGYVMTDGLFWSSESSYYERSAFAISNSNPNYRQSFPSATILRVRYVYDL